MEQQQQTGAHAPVPENPMPAPEWERPQHRTRNIVIAASCALCIIGATALGLALTLPGNERAEEGYGMTLSGPDLTNPEPAIPGDLRVLVDAWGQKPPEDGVSATYAAALASDVAERYFGVAPAGRAQVTLANSEKNFDPEYFQVTGNFVWDVQLETEEGSVTVSVDAQDGSDAWATADRDFSDRYEGTWLERFDEWDRTGISPSDEWFGSEEEALSKAADELIQEPLSDEELSNEVRAERIEAYEIKRDGAAEFMNNHKDDPRAEAAMKIVNETGLGEGAKAVSAEWASEGSAFSSTSMIDVTLDNGKHLFCYLRGFDPDYELMRYERHDSSYLDTMYGNKIAKLQALIDRES